MNKWELPGNPTHLLIPIKDIEAANVKGSHFETNMNIVRLVEKAKQISLNEDDIGFEANAYAEKYAFRVPYDSSGSFYDDKDFKASKDGYKQALLDILK